MTKQQELSLELISLGQHNHLKGDKIAEDLRANRNLWISVYGYFSGFQSYYHLIPLRDMLQSWHIDSIAIVCPKNEKPILLELIKQWNPSEIFINEDADDDFQSFNFFRKNNKSILIELWWD